MSFAQNKNQDTNQLIAIQKDSNIILNLENKTNSNGKKNFMNLIYEGRNIINLNFENKIKNSKYYQENVQNNQINKITSSRDLSNHKPNIQLNDYHKEFYDKSCFPLQGKYRNFFYFDLN